MVLERKLAYFNLLLRLCGSQGLQLSYEQPDGKFTRWYAYTYIDQFRYPNVHRSLLDNEFVFDIDANAGTPEVEFEAAKAYLQHLVARLKQYAIPYTVWSSGRLFHVHVFYDFNNMVFDDDQAQQLHNLIHSHFAARGPAPTPSEVNALGHRIIRTIPLVLVQDLNNEKAWVDVQKFKSTRALIRAEGSINRKTGFYKTYLSDDLDFRAKREDEVVYPKTLQLWRPKPEVFLDLFFKAYRLLPKESPYNNELKHTNAESTSSAFGTRGIYYIDRLLAYPVADGRHRLVYLVFAPYFMNVCHLSESEAMATIKDYLFRCSFLYPVNISDEYILYQLQYAKAHNRMPLSKEKLFELLREIGVDVKEIIKVKA